MILDNDFIGRWVESRKASQQKYSAFNDLQDMFKNIYKDGIDSTKIEILYNHLKEDLEFYTLIIDNNIQDKIIQNKILFLLHAGNERYSINLLLALFRNVQYDGKVNSNINDFIITYERYILYMLLNPSSKFSNAPIYEAIKYLNEKKFSNAIKVFEIDAIKISALKNLIAGEIKDNAIGKLLIAKYIWSLENQIAEDVVEQSLNFDKSTLEHIIPQNPEQNTNWLTDFTLVFRNEFTYRLGNMTLLTKSMNSKARNFDFLTKKEEYKKTKLAITQRISSLDIIDESYIEMRDREILNTIYTDLQI